MRALMYVAPLAALIGCTLPQKPPLTAEQAAQRTEVQDTNFDAQATLLGPQQTSYTARGLLNDRVTWRVRVFIDKKSSAAFAQLYAEVWHQDRNGRNYRSISTALGEQVTTVRIDYEPRCMAGGGIVSCSHSETFGAVLTPAAWRQAIESGTTIRLNSQSGLSNEIVIPVAYAQGIMKAADAKGARFAGLTGAAIQAAPAASAGAAPEQAIQAPAVRPAVIGQESHQVERMPEVRACAAQPVAQLVAKAPGVETYSVRCASGDLMTIRCEAGACRVLK